MIKRTLLCAALIYTLILTACNHGITNQKLAGDWRYVKIDKPRSGDLTDTVTADELKENAPYITFDINNQLIIHWGGKILSHGTYVLNGDNINYTEQLEGGKTRTFPFYVSKLDDKNIIFETLDNQGSRVTAVKK